MEDTVSVPLCHIVNYVFKPIPFFSKSHFLSFFIHAYNTYFILECLGEPTQKTQDIQRFYILCKVIPHSLGFPHKILIFNKTLHVLYDVTWQTSAEIRSTLIEIVTMYVNYQTITIKHTPVSIGRTHEVYLIIDLQNPKVGLIYV